MIGRFTENEWLCACVCVQVCIPAMVKSVNSFIFLLNMRNADTDFW